MNKMFLQPINRPPIMDDEYIYRPDDGKQKLVSRLLDGILNYNDTGFYGMSITVDGLDIQITLNICALAFDSDNKELLKYLKQVDDVSFEPCEFCILCAIRIKDFFVAIPD